MRRKKMNNLIKGFRTLAMSLALIGTMLIGPMRNTATASAFGCTWAPSGTVCISVVGSGLRVKTITAIRNKVSKEMICHYSAKVKIKPPSGPSYDLPTKSRSSCVPGNAWFDWHVNKDYPHGTRIYVYFYEGGKQQGGAPAQTVKKKDSWPLW